MENITASEVAGLGVGALLFCATIAAPKIDALISASQRSSLGMCKRCGDLRMIACSRCKGMGLVKGGPINLSIVDDLYQSFGGGSSTMGSASCTKCQAKGCMSCPDCSKLS
ncbi:chaperone [Tasmannia lanceolata]|uniref:chaperone n=1 Tax=Tasmannia lanceolata TaxID=3420 RepID=UPI0040643BA3